MDLQGEGSSSRTAHAVDSGVAMLKEHARDEQQKMQEQRVFNKPAVETPTPEGMSTDSSTSSPRKASRLITLDSVVYRRKQSLELCSGNKAMESSSDCNKNPEGQLSRIFKNEEKTKQFFQLVKERDQLWNVNSPLFNDEDIPVWTRLMTTLDPEMKQKKPVDIEKLAARLKNEWQKIQDQYHDAMLKEKPYKYEEHLEFVKEIVKNRAEAPVEIQIKLEPKDEIQIEIEKEDGDSDVEQAETDALASCSSPPKKKIKIEYDEDPDLDEEEGVGDGSGDGNDEDEDGEEGEDEDLAFFASITSDVKSLPEDGKLEFRKEVMKVLRRLKKKYEKADVHKGKKYRQVGKTVNIE